VRKDVEKYINCKHCNQKSLLKIGYHKHSNGYDIHHRSDIIKYLVGCCVFTANGYLIWSDGKIYTYRNNYYVPENSYENIIGKCNNCKSIIWINEYKVTEVIFDSYNTTDYYNPVKYLRRAGGYKKPCVRNFFIEEDLTLYDYIRYLRKNLNTLSEHKELVIRKIIWSLLNDRRRGIKKYDLSKFEIINLKKLFQLIPFDSDENLFLKIEIQRALGNFKEAEKLLSKVDSTKYKYEVINIKYAIKQKNPCLIQVFNNCYCEIRKKSLKDLKYWRQILN